MGWCVSAAPEDGTGGNASLGWVWNWAGIRLESTALKPLNQRFTVPGKASRVSHGSGKGEERAQRGRGGTCHLLPQPPQRCQRCLTCPALRRSRAGSAHPESQRLSQIPAHSRIRELLTPDLGVIPGQAIPRGVGLGDPCGSFHAAGITLGHSPSCALVLPQPRRKP